MWVNFVMNLSLINDKIYLILLLALILEMFSQETEQ